MKIGNGIAFIVIFLVVIALIIGGIWVVKISTHIKIEDKHYRIDYDLHNQINIIDEYEGIIEQNNELKNNSMLINDIY